MTHHVQVQSHEQEDRAFSPFAHTCSALRIHLPNHLCPGKSPLDGNVVLRNPTFTKLNGPKLLRGDYFFFFPPLRAGEDVGLRANRCETGPVAKRWRRERQRDWDLGWPCDRSRFPCRDFHSSIIPLSSSPRSLFGLFESTNAKLLASRLVISLAEITSERSSHVAGTGAIDPGERVGYCLSSCLGNPAPLLLVFHNMETGFCMMILDSCTSLYSSFLFSFFFPPFIL